MYVIRLLQKMRSPSGSIELWRQAQAMILNFPQVSMQERYLEAFANALKDHQSYSETHALWQQLLTDARYIGRGATPARSVAKVGKAFLQIAPWQEFQSSYDYICQAIDELPSEQEKVELLKSIASTLAVCSDFSPDQSEWQKLLDFPSYWKSEDSQSNAYLELSKIVAAQGDADKKRSFFKYARKLLDKIKKPQQLCEGTLFLPANMVGSKCPKNFSRCWKKQ